MVIGLREVDPVADDEDVADLLRRVEKVADLIEEKGWDPHQMTQRLLDELTPDSPPKIRAGVHFARGMVYLRLELHEPAKDCLEEAVDGFAAFPLALVLLGVVSLCSGWLPVVGILSISAGIWMFLRTLGIVTIETQPAA